MNVILAVTKNCRHCLMLKKELERIGVNYTIHYFEEHPDLVEKVNIKHSPLIIADDEVVFNGMPSISALEKYFDNKKKNHVPPS